MNRARPPGPGGAPDFFAPAAARPRCTRASAPPRARARSRARRRRRAAAPSSCSARAATSRYARRMIVPSLSLTSRSSQRKCWRFWTHSKYETTTPPALASTSGTTKTPLSLRISSAVGVVGLLAPSMTARALSGRRCSAWIIPPSAAGMRTSHSRPISSSAVDHLDARELRELPARRRCGARSAWGSMPASQRIAPNASETPTIFAAEVGDDPRRPRADVAEALHDDARLRRAEAERSARPRGTCRRRRGPSPPRVRSEPPSEIGLPVTIAGVWPWSLPYSSIIQAIICAFVLTSGAGMSRVGPSTFSILSMNERVIRCSSSRR